MIDGTQRLGTALEAWDGGERGSLLGAGGHPAEELNGQQGQVYGQEEVQVLIARREAAHRERSFDASERARVGVIVGDYGRVSRKVRAVPGDVWCNSQGAEFCESVLDERAAVELDERLVAPHARALAAGEDEGVHPASSSKKRMMDSMPR